MMVYTSLRDKLRRSLWADEQWVLEAECELLAETRLQLWTELHSGCDPSREERVRHAFSVVTIKDCLTTSESELERFPWLDRALIVGHPSLRNLLLEAVGNIEETLPPLNLKADPLPETPISEEDAQANLPPFGLEVVQAPMFRPSIAAFLSECFGRRPAIISGYVDQWPAFTKWRDLTFWRTHAGHRCVPVELGGAYTNSSFRPEMMRLDRFIDMYLARSDSLPSIKASRSEEKGYLAQHGIFEQIPSLRHDIVEPEFASLGESSSEPVVNLWLGPRHTETPLHCDPTHNLLAQVLGTKLVVAIPPEDSELVYPITSDSALSNTSQVDILDVDESKFPRFREAKTLKFLLRPGEMLYLPPRWWHYVASLSTSCSVSFWFS